ncbi:zinc ribbon domain-containing protein [Clostridium tepidum]|jgi:ribosomal protein L37E|uniref:Zinc-ribbon domain-containing protein n=1 Tax=Clostridium tepidum TaxID=1962263 RepID=A0A1S9I618_9CLOT|nr:zinc ribbon domain-containing protein [Clostridium tepidum]MCR1934300.1 zinc ribbon domain-containing protein [Clostridium tepidum]MDU6877966.1 zinc ribbon domain-containing protein [Clostridium botulinum]OOO62283.1 zinc-ribbon domain-containing protein [Clostridium tepidum]OOO65733.1 zinc-ribbon domain-containing protein [Clostridium tepidum]
MFFFGIFGINTRQKEIEEFQNLICKKCGNLSRYTVIKTYNIFHFFFIPLIKWGEKYYLKSRCCNTIYVISKEDLDRIREGEDINNIYLKEIYMGNSNTNDIIICNECGKEVDSSFNFCPHCGQKL